MSTPIASLVEIEEPTPFTVRGTGERSRHILYRPSGYYGDCGGGGGHNGGRGSGLSESYANLGDLADNGLPENVQFDFGLGKLQNHLRRASSEADTMVCHRFNVPLTHVSRAFVGWICEIAVKFAYDVRGYRPEEIDEQKRVLGNFKSAMQRLKDTQCFLITPDRELLNTEEPIPATVWSHPRRGWV